MKVKQDVVRLIDFIWVFYVIKFLEWRTIYRRKLHRSLNWAEDVSSKESNQGQRWNCRLLLNFNILINIFMKI